MSRLPALFAAFALTALGASPASAGSTYRPPVDGPVIDGFHIPDGPFGAGNRGLDYATEPGEPVRAIGAGLVVFAGPVAGQRYVTVLHPDGLRSSYGSLAEVTVAVGERVAQGQVVGRAGELLHLGVRTGGTYLDPATLFASASVRLVPLRPEGATTPATVAPQGGQDPLPTAVWSWLLGGGAGEATGTLARRS